VAGLLTRKSWRELSHHKARTFFTVATIAAAVIGMWLFAVPPLIDGAMGDRIESDLLWDLRLSPNGIVLSDTDIATIRDLPNVAGIEARVTTNAQLRVDGREMRAWLIGVDDFVDQEVNAVIVSEGRAPLSGEVLTDPQNARTGRYRGGIGDQFTFGGVPWTVSGVGSSLEFAATVDDADPVFYLPLAALQDAIGYQAISWIDIRVGEHNPELVTATADALRNYLSTIDPEITYWEVLQVREPGSWPEKESFDNVIRLSYVIAALGMASALLMVYTTMNTLVRGQTREIGVLKAVGGPRRAIVRSYLQTAALLGGLGTAIGVVIGVVLSNLLVGFAGRQFSGVEAGFGVPVWVLILSIVVGLGGTMLAALPAVRQTVALPVRDALTDHGVRASFGAKSIDGMLRRSRFLPRSWRLGIRNAARRKGRSIATAVQIGFAVGTFLGFLAMGITVTALSAQTFDAQGGDIWVRGPTDATGILTEIPGVADVIPVYYADVGIGGDTFSLQGQTPEAAVLHDQLDEGRWFSPAEETAAQPVTVLGPAVATATGARVGDVLEVETITGPTTLEVVGIDTLMVEDGKVLYTPLSTAIELRGGGAPNNYYVVTTDSDEASIDSVAAQIQGTLVTNRLGGTVETRYIEKRAEMSQARTILAILMILGIPVVAIGMIGLINTMTINIIERTREIGILRSIGARARHIRRMIRAEALVLGLLGWLAAIPIGYAVGFLLTELLSSGFGVDFDVQYPLWPLPLALAVTLLMITLGVRFPARRAIRLQPGAALRYE
jgi:putative ABC transport system permease protein